MEPTRVPRSGLSWKDVQSIKDPSVRRAVEAALRNDRMISDSEVDTIIAAALGDVEFKKGQPTRRTSEQRRLSNEEIKALYMIADKSSSLTPRGRAKLLKFLEGVAATELMYGKDERDRSTWWFTPKMNFAGPGFRGEFYWRPRDLFDFAAKIHDLNYQINGSDIGEKKRDKFAQSRIAKADYIFREMCKFCKVKGALPRLYHWAARQLFAGEDRKEFLAGDGFLNCLVVPDVYKKLRDWRFTLMIPLTHVAEWEEKYLNSLKGDKKYSTPIYSDLDDHCGFHRWFTEKFKPIWPKITITGQTGPG